MLADIPQPCSAEEGVDQGVGHHIRIAMALQPCFSFELDSGENQPPSLGETVYVKAYPDTHGSSLRVGRGLSDMRLK
jgi:hypothetical protein